MKMNLKSQLELLKQIRKPTLPSSVRHRSKKDYNRQSFKKEK